MSPSLSKLIARSGTHHHAWRGYIGGNYRGRRVLYAWPDGKHLNNVWNVEANAIAVIEWNEQETAAWIEDVRALQLFAGRTVESAAEPPVELDPLPNGVDAILEYVARMAAGYSSGLNGTKMTSSRPT